MDLHFKIKQLYSGLKRSIELLSFSFFSLMMTQLWPIIQENSCQSFNLKLYIVTPYHKTLSI